FNFFDELIKRDIDYCSNIKILGLMTIAQFTKNRDKIDYTFYKVKSLFDEINVKYKKINFIDMKYISMGMSSDYDLAIKNGANIIRIGEKIFGKRNLLESVNKNV
ncbi:MAG: hypothetical protein LBF97_06950, partial [Elusimicrobiota bacterium]|nr:hypothetical protein [Elusimicrobiota bacterium]